MVVVFCQFENCFRAVEVVFEQHPGLFELREHAIDRRETDFDPLVEQFAIDVVGTQMARAFLREEFENFDSRVGGFEPFFPEVDVGFCVHGNQRG